MERTTCHTTTGFEPQHLPGDVRGLMGTCLHDDIPLDEFVYLDAMERTGSIPCAPMLQYLKEVAWVCGLLDKPFVPNQQRGY